MKQKLRVGSRESKLAVMQTNLVIDCIKQNNPNIEVELITMKTTGDMILDTSLDQVGGKGLFVKELDRGLRDGMIDIAVHSLKDMPMITPEDLPILAYSERENPYDALVLPKGETMFDASKPFGCSSARRSLQLKQMYPNLHIEGIRGNVLLRLEKVDRGTFGGTVLACAGLKRLGLHNRITKVFSADEMIPSAGQGILAVQGRADEDHGYLVCVNNASSQYAALAERAFVRGLDGDCSSPIAAYAKISQEKLILTGLYYDEKTQQPYVGTLEDDITKAETIGIRLADRLIAESLK